MSFPNIKGARMGGRRWLMLAGIFVSLGLLLHTVFGDKVERDPKPRIAFDPAKPFRLDFGRGSGWHGLDTVAVGEDGTVALHRQQREKIGGAYHEFWETASLTLNATQLRDAGELIAMHRLTKLEKSYYDPDIMDGTQWVLWLRQAGSEKAVYFNNSFPNIITGFSRALDEFLNKAGQAKAEWKRVPKEDSRRHEKALWKAIK